MDMPHLVNCSPRVRPCLARAGALCKDIASRKEAGNARSSQSPSRKAIRVIAMQVITDFLVVGSGIAGLSFALKAAHHGRVAILTKNRMEESNSFYAQGGIASVLGDDDSFDEHIQDTISAGAGLSREAVVRDIVTAGPERIRELIDWGVQFNVNKKGDAEHPGFDLGKEGGHSKRRVIHVDDITGQAVVERLLDMVKEEENITIYENHLAVDLLMSKAPKDGDPNACWGAYVLEKKSGEVHLFLSKATILVTGGAGKVYLYTSNPDIASGDGIAMAYRAGAKIANMEFFQFHPTCLYHPRAKSFLISETVRGEGGILRLEDGTPFMEQYHPMKDLAPRDIVARAIDKELKKSGSDCLFLDITHRSESFLKDRFPNIHRTCLGYGIDIAREPIPVVPAAHYLCGGVSTDTAGRTNIDRLYAVGETACTGLHGANRLASNSLLEALVISHRACEASVENISPKVTPPEFPTWSSGQAAEPDEIVVVSHNWDEIRRLMWNYVGIFRSNKRLERAKRRIDGLLSEIFQYYWGTIITPDLIELRNIAVVADLIITSAIARRESRGLHYNINYPETDDTNCRQDTILWTGHSRKPGQVRQ